MTKPAKHAKTETLTCHVCKTETEHELLCTKQREGKEALGSYNEEPEWGWWSIQWDVFQCMGCKEVTTRRTANHSEADFPNEEFYPPRGPDQERVPPTWVGKLPDGMDDLLREVYSAINSRAYRLAAMGLRSLLDDLMTETLGDIGGFEQKVAAMLKDGYLSKIQHKVLDPTLELGHAAMHRGHQPSGSQLDAAIGIVEGMLHLFYIQSKVIEALTQGVKPRQKVVKPKTKAPPDGNGKG